MLSRFDSRIKSAYFAPTLNWLDLPAGFLACAACVVALDGARDAAKVVVVQERHAQSDRQHVEKL